MYHSEMLNINIYSYISKYVYMMNTFHHGLLHDIKTQSSSFNRHNIFFENSRLFDIRANTF